MTKPKMAGKATREKLRQAGVDPAIVDKPDLTLEEAHVAIGEKRLEDELEAHRATLRLVGHELADSPDLHLDDARLLADEAERLLAVRACGPAPRTYGKTGLLLMPIDDSEGITEIVGESYHMDALRRIVQKAQAEGRAVSNVAHGWAVLVPEPENPHDENAVAVTIDEKKVGHLSRDDAEGCQQELLDLRDQLQTLLCVPASLYTGSKGLIGVEIHWDTCEVPDAELLREARRAEAAASIEAERAARERDLAREREQARAAKQGARAKAREAKLARKAERAANPPPPMNPKVRQLLLAGAAAILLVAALGAVVLLRAMDFF